MAPVLGLLALGFAAFGFADAIITASCDPDYECQYTYVDANLKLWEYDFSTLCAAGDYNITDQYNHTYFFNICGMSRFRCIPTWRETYTVGVAVQTWGDPPTCNQSAKACQDPTTKQPICCTANCEVLGVGIPLFKPIDPNNPFYGGVSITHSGVPPTNTDMNKCPYNNKTGQMVDRSIKFKILCEPELPLGQPILISAVQNDTNPCSYEITMKASESCGCDPQCFNKNCGPDGCGGYCGGLEGLCPSLINMTCTSEQVCCRPNCQFRDCGNDGCGGSCGTCGLTKVCTQEQRCQAIASSTPTAEPSPSVTPTVTRSRGFTESPSSSSSVTPTSPAAIIVHKEIVQTSSKAVAGAFLGGMLGTLAIGGGVAFLLIKRGGVPRGPAAGKFLSPTAGTAPPAPYTSSAAAQPASKLYGT